MIEHVLIVVVSGLFAVGIWYLWFVEYRAYRLDKFRQHLFWIRDDLFMRAVKEEVPFDSVAYRMTRDMLNGSLRFAHELGVFRLVMVFWESKKNRKLQEVFVHDMKGALEELSEDQKKVILTVHAQMHLAMLHHLIKSSAVLMMLVLVSGSLVLGKKSFDKRLATKKDRLAFLDARAQSIGHTVC